MEPQKSNDRLRALLLDFSGLPESTKPEELNQNGIAAWDSLAVVQMIAEQQGVFAVEFGFDEVESLRSFDERQTALKPKRCSDGHGLI